MLAAIDDAAVPSAYRAGLGKARTMDRELADNYLRHVLLGDPDADHLIESLSALPPAEGQRWIRVGMDAGTAGLADAPEVVRAFFQQAEIVPAWYRPDLIKPGYTAFHRHSEMFIGAFVAGVLVEGFATLISKSFSITGRVVDQGVRRLKQNNRHIMEIMLPGGLERQGEGWKLSVRIRLVHARIRQMLKHSPDWDAPAWGVPISAAHMALATAVFSALLLKRAEALGVRLSQEEREGFMMIWRYTGHLMGVPESILFDSERSALRLCELGMACEPPPSMESIQLANALINSAPVVAGITDPEARRALAKYIYRISRALIGQELADQFNFPKYGTFGVLAALRLKNAGSDLLRRVFPHLESRIRRTQFTQFMDVSLYPDEGIRYRMPEKLYAEQDKEL